MSISSPSNSIWPSNGIIGSEQIQIPDGINEKWPEGDAIVGNFVYKEGKLMGFVDCKSLVVNDSKSTTIPYDYAELELPSILKDTMTITGGERCKNLIVNCLEDAAVYITPMLKEILGDAKFITKFIKKENKLVVHTDRVDDTTLEAVTALLDYELPESVIIERYNQSIDIPWQDWQPGLRQVDWVGTDGNQKVATDLYLDSSTRVETLIKSYAETTYKEFLSSTSASPNMYGFSQQYAKVWVQKYGSEGQIYSIHYNMPDSGTDILIEMEKGSTWLNGVKQSAVAKNPDAVFECTAPAFLFSHPNGHSGISCTIGYLRVLKNGVLVRNYIPVVDELGNGCLYDTVTRTPKYSTGTKGLLHPEQETEVATYSLRRPVMYGELTVHGLRRLYHVPAGYNGSKEEYAEENGFKPIVETEQPETGYWSPQWHETDEEIILEWIEIEEPNL